MRVLIATLALCAFLLGGLDTTPAYAGNETKPSKTFEVKDGIGCIYVTAWDDKGEVNVFDLQGVHVARVGVKYGEETQIPLSPGIYIAKLVSTGERVRAISK